MLRKQFIVEENSKRVAVVINIDDYKLLLKDLRDISRLIEQQDSSSRSMQDLRNQIRNFERDLEI